MSQAGKPLRFLGVVMGGWVALRLGATSLPLLWEAGRPATVVAEATVVSRNQPASTALAAALVPVATTTRPGIQGNGRIHPLPFMQAMPVPPSAIFASAPEASSPWTVPVASGAPSRLPLTESSLAARPPPSSSPILLPSRTQAGMPRPPSGSPWSLMAWALWRSEGANGLAQAPLLGGSQGGVRLDYRLWTAGDRFLGFYGRFTRALERPSAEEAAFGVSLRPIKGLPVSLLAERRQRLGIGGRSGFAFMAAGGIGPKPVASRLEIEGYAQAGVVTLPGSDAFGDGRFSLDYRLTRKGSGSDLAIGAAVSGGAQTGASRLDIGPEIRLRLPVAHGHLRLSVEWRERVAGTARPSSGPAIAVVADF